jgi:hypothetical protein
MKRCWCKPGHPRSLLLGGLPPKAKTPWYTRNKCGSSRPMYRIFVVMSRTSATGFTKRLIIGLRRLAAITNTLTRTIAWAVDRCSAIYGLPSCRILGFHSRGYEEYCRTYGDYNRRGTGWQLDLLDHNYNSVTVYSIYSSLQCIRFITHNNWVPSLPLKTPVPTLQPLLQPTLMASLAITSHNWLGTVRSWVSEWITTDGQSVSLSWCCAPSGAHDHILITIWLFLSTSELYSPGADHKENTVSDSSIVVRRHYRNGPPKKTTVPSIVALLSNGCKQAFPLLTVDLQRARHSIIFWDMTPCSLLSCNRHFGGTCRLHLQGRRIISARTSRQTGSNPEDGDDMFIRNVGCNSTDYTASYPRR